jgi:hypothetical protein
LFVVVYALVSISGASIVPGLIKRILVHQVRFPIPLTILWLAILGDLVRGRSNGRAITETG